MPNRKRKKEKRKVTQKKYFAEIFKNLTRYKSENNFVGYQNNYVNRSDWLL